MIQLEGDCNYCAYKGDGNGVNHLFGFEKAKHNG